MLNAWSTAVTANGRFSITVRMLPCKPPTCTDSLSRAVIVSFYFVCFTLVLQFTV